ncbi:MAG: T9SS type A sorting domain-containing protein [Bacteroidetes bacterium]|nr:T9SS type A sorting domain-containing protein [Bacteroidota bacterium]
MILFVTITDTNGCFNSDTISVNHVVCLGQNELTPSGIKVSVFPNHLQIDLPSSISSARFKLIDIFGRVIIDEDIHDDQYIDISKLHTGVYIYNMGNYSGKFFKG